MISLSSYLAQARGCVLLIGPPGAGKTTLLTQIPGMVIIECDDNIKGPGEYVSRCGLLRSDTRIVVPHLDEKNALIPRLKRFQAFRAAVNSALNDPTVQAIAIDSITTMQQYVLDEIREQQGRAQNADPMSGDVKLKKEEGMAIQDWGPFYTYMTNILITMKASGKLIIWTGHVDVREDENVEGSKVLKKYLNVPGQLRSSLAGYFSEVWIAEVDASGKRWLRTRSADFREEGLGLKTASDLPPRFEMDFKRITATLLQ